MMPTTPGAALLRRLYVTAASLAACAVVDARSSVHLTCDNNLRINPPEGERKEEKKKRRSIEMTYGNANHYNAIVYLEVSMVAHFPLRTAS